MFLFQPQLHLKSPVAYYLMLLYITVMFKPLIPIISDAYSHTFNRMAHIATVHAKYGSNHLAAELADTGKDDNGKNQDIPKPVSEVPLHIATDECAYNFHPGQTDNKYFVFTLCRFPGVYILNQGPPPKLSY